MNNCALLLFLSCVFEDFYFTQALLKLKTCTLTQVNFQEKKKHSLRFHFDVQNTLYKGIRFFFLSFPNFFLVRCLFVKCDLPHIKIKYQTLMPPKLKSVLN